MIIITHTKSVIYILNTVVNRARISMWNGATMFESIEIWAIRFC
jgi:hypothetical protein